MRSSRMILANLFGFFLHKLFLEDKNWKPLNLILVKWQFFFKLLSFQNRLSYWTLLDLEWKIFCHSLLIRFHFHIGYWSLAAMNMSRCPYIYELDSNDAMELFLLWTFQSLPWLPLINEIEVKRVVRAALVGQSVGWSVGRAIRM